MQGAAFTIIASIYENIFASDVNDVGVCDYSEGNFEGNSICVNTYYNAGISILAAIVLVIIDAIIPWCSQKVYSYNHL